MKDLVIAVIPVAEDRLASLHVTADAQQVDDPATADLHRGDGFTLHPAAHHVLCDVFDAERLGEHKLRAERRATQIVNAFRISLCVEPHYSRLFHSFCPIIMSTGN